MKRIFIFLVIFALSFQLWCSNKKMEENKLPMEENKLLNEEDILPIYGVWNPINTKAGFTNEYTKNGIFKRAYDALIIEKEEKKPKGMVEGEIGIIYDIGDDVRIIGIDGNYPKYRIKFKHRVSLLNDKKEYYEAWITGELNINFKSRDEMIIELVKIDLDKDNERYENVIKYLKMLLKPGIVYKRAEKLDKPITPDAP